MRILEDYVSLHARVCPQRTALVCGTQRIDYAQLWAMAAERAAAIAANTQGRALIRRASQGIDFVVDYLAAHVADRVFVPLEKDTPEGKYTEIQSIVERADIPSEVADILFTTGTTGQQKGTMLSQRAIVSNAENLIAAQGFTSAVAFVISGPLNHIGSLSKLWPVLIVGGTLLITDGLKDIESFYQALEYPAERFATFLVPSALRYLMQFDQERWARCAPKFDFIETGAAPMSQTDMEQLSLLFPHTRLYNTYASTETGIISTHDYCHDGCIAGCLGRPMRHSRLFITPEGTVACQGSTLMTGYLGDPALTQSILRDGTLYTHDVGRIDAQGRLRLEGRKGDVINIGGYKVSPVEIEDAAMSFPGISDCVCVSRSHPLMGNVLKLYYVPRGQQSIDRKALAQHLRHQLEQYKVPTLYEEATHIARTYNGKLDRRHYEE